ncbi:MAG: hypothetical protein IPL49_18110 [Saprospirales bacterium]|nr:hypothetical protein [Saprospirales bacterium]
MKTLLILLLFLNAFLMAQEPIYLKTRRSKILPNRAPRQGMDHCGFDGETLRMCSRVEISSTRFSE